MVNLVVICINVVTYYHVSLLMVGNYIGKSSYKFMEVKQAFEYAYDVLSKQVLKEDSCSHDR